MCPLHAPRLYVLVCIRHVPLCAPHAPTACRAGSSFGSPYPQAFISTARDAQLRSFGRFGKTIRCCSLEPSTQFMCPVTVPSPHRWFKTEHGLDMGDVDGSGGGPRHAAAVTLRCSVGPYDTLDTHRSDFKRAFVQACADQNSRLSWLFGSIRWLSRKRRWHVRS